MDGGSEFITAFEQACANLGTRLNDLLFRSPKLNGGGASMQSPFGCVLRI